MTTMTEQTVRDQVASALRHGGRVRVTVTSRKTGRHLTVRLAAKKRGEDGRFISRARIEGRVGVNEADVLFADADDAAFGGWVGTLYFDSGEWKTPASYDDERGVLYEWCARAVVRWALGTDLGARKHFEDRTEVVLASECCYCGKTLTDPQSIERGIGPECFGRHTDSTHV